jgi:hypothetical protein
MRNPPCDISSAASIAAFLCTLGAVGVQDPLTDKTVWLSPLDWDFVPDVRYLDRLCAVPKSGNAMVAKIDLSHRRLYATKAAPYWETIAARPAYPSIPAGEIDAKPELPNVQLGARYRMTEDANYYGGQCVPAGTVLIAAGYKTATILNRGRLAVAFEPIAEFPDGTFRLFPLRVELITAAETVAA